MSCPVLFQQKNATKELKKNHYLPEFFFFFFFFFTKLSTLDLSATVVCQEFRPVGSVRESPGGHLRMRVSPKWELRGLGRVGQR